MHGLSLSARMQTSCSDTIALNFSKLNHRELTLYSLASWTLIYEPDLLRYKDSNYKAFFTLHSYDLIMVMTEESIQGQLNNGMKQYFQASLKKNN